MIHKHAHQPVADRQVQEGGDHTRIDAAGQSQQHFAIADLRAHPAHRILDDIADAPQRIAAADLAHEALQNPRALQRMRDFRMELHPVITASLIAHGGERGIAGGGGGDKAIGELRDPIAVTHPHIQYRATLAVAAVTEAIQQSAPAGDREFRIAELPLPPEDHLAPQLLRHGLHAVADAQHRHAQRKHRVGCSRWLRINDGFGTAGEDDATRRECAHGLIGDIPGVDFTVHTALAHPARNQLGVLRAEIENKDPVRVDVRGSWCRHLRKSRRRGS